MKTEYFSCKHKALCNNPSQTVLIIQDNELKAREDLLAQLIC